MILEPKIQLCWLNVSKESSKLNILAFAFWKKKTKQKKEPCEFNFWIMQIGVYNWILFPLLYSFLNEADQIKESEFESYCTLK